MFDTMKKIRLVVMVPEEERDILRAESGITGEDMGDIVARLVRTGLPEAAAAVRARKAKKKSQGKEQTPESP